MVEQQNHSKDTRSRRSSREGGMINEFHMPSAHYMTYDDMVVFIHYAKTLPRRFIWEITREIHMHCHGCGVYMGAITVVFLRGKNEILIC